MLEVWYETEFDRKVKPGIRYLYRGYISHWRIYYELNEFFNNWTHLNLSSLVTIGFSNCAFSKQGYIDSSYCYGYWIGVEFIACNISHEP